MLHIKFGQDCSRNFLEEDVNGRRTTDDYVDGCQDIAIGHLSDSVDRKMFMKTIMYNSIQLLFANNVTKVNTMYFN